MFSYYIIWSITYGFITIQKIPKQKEMIINKRMLWEDIDKIECIINVNSANKAVVKKAFKAKFNL